MSDIDRLLAIMAALRTPGSGCPWDLEQDYASIAPYTIEEAYEVADAIARGNLADLREELGDLLLQVVFHARMAQEEGAFDFADVVASLNEKLIRRHPHVFGDAKGLTPREVEGLWERIKTQERMQKPKRETGEGALAGPGRPPCPDPRPQAPGQGRQGRVRLERCARSARQDPRGNQRDRGGAGAPGYRGGGR
jgi:nucleoside triphosphate diphosphatase